MNQKLNCWSAEPRVLTWGSAPFLVDDIDYKVDGSKLFSGPRASERMRRSRLVYSGLREGESMA